MKVCSAIKRDPEFISKYFKSELQKNMSISSSGILIINGYYKSSQLESIFKKFIDEYVKCHVCKTLDTTLKKDQVSRLSYVKCMKCTSQYYIKKIDF